MAGTREIQFNPKSDLPRWANRDSRVVSLCRVDLGFRANVIEAQTRQYKNHLKRIAQKRIETLQ